jgi:hypothetical protein
VRVHVGKSRRQATIVTRVRLRNGHTVTKRHSYRFC